MRQLLSIVCFLLALASAVFASALVIVAFGEYHASAHMLAPITYQVLLAFSASGWVTAALCLGMSEKLYRMEELRMWNRVRDAVPVLLAVMAIAKRVMPRDRFERYERRMMAGWGFRFAGIDWGQPR